MSVGSQTTQAKTDSTLTALATQMRDLATNVLHQQAFLNKLGLTGLQGLGYTAADAQTVLNDANYMATVMQVYKGTATQATVFNFEDALTSLWAGS